LKKYIIYFSFILFSFAIYAEDTTSDPNNIMDFFKVTATFGDNRDDHFHTGMDLAAVDLDVRAIMDSELIFYNKNRSRSIPYGNGNFVIMDNTENKLRVNYSHLKDGTFNDKKNQFKKNETIAVVGSTGHSTGSHLHLEIEDLQNNRLLNPIGFINVKDTLSPRIEEVYFITKENEKISLVQNSKLKRGGKLFIHCMDRINNSQYDATPYKITVIIDGKENGILTFDYFKKIEDNYTISNTDLKYEDIYVNKKENDYYLTEFYSLPDLVGLKIVVEDFSGNKTEFKKPIKILPPETEQKKNSTALK
jgi:murein DD-endopeptidase MepM/ murein hydrolase activator NlpD